MNGFDILSHYDYPRLDVECGCPLCVEWRHERNAFDLLKMQTFTHDRSCRCWRCQKRRECQQSFLATAARRELFSEMSYHAANHPKYGPQLMLWVARELQENDETDGWWATLAQAYPLSFWFGRFQSALAPTNTATPVSVAPMSIKVEPKPIAKANIPQWWCTWCGGDLPLESSEFCSDTCYADYVSDKAATRPAHLVRRKLAEFVSVCSQTVSGSLSWAVSGIAA